MSVANGSVSNDIASADIETKIKAVISRAALSFPAHISADLMQLMEPAAIASMSAVAAAWAGAHLLGAGEIADAVLLSVGVLALGGVALQAGEALYLGLITTVQARTVDDYDKAATELAKAVSLLGVEVILYLLTRRKPLGTFGVPFRSIPPLKVTLKYQLPRNGRFAYTPKMTFVSNEIPGWGATITWSGDMRVSKLGTREDRLLAIYHERVHSFLVPKLYLLRNLRCHMSRAGYVRSYLLRYLEEALAETISRIRVSGLSRQNVISGIQFPLKHGATYKLSIAALGEEMRGIVYGPITVAGMVYKVFQGSYFNDE